MPSGILDKDACKSVTYKCFIEKSKIEKKVQASIFHDMVQAKLKGLKHYKQNELGKWNQCFCTDTRCIDDRCSLHTSDSVNEIDGADH